MRDRSSIAITAACLIATTTWVERWTAPQPHSQKHPYASDSVMTSPSIFGLGLISGQDFDSHPAFTPDGKTLYFVRSTPIFSFWTILVSRFENGLWREPEVAPFSGEYSDADPFVTADGSQLFFISKRPVPGRSDQHTDIWMMRKTNSGWGEPVNLGMPVNSNASEWYPTVALDGTLYFGSNRAGGRGLTDLYRSRLVDGKYQVPENLGAVVNTEFDEFEPYVAPDQSFLLFMASGKPDAIGGFDLYLSYNRMGQWTSPVNLGKIINSTGDEYCPMISPDSRYFFWTSCRENPPGSPGRRLAIHELTKNLRSAGNGLGDIYQIDISVLGIARSKH